MSLNDFAVQLYLTILAIAAAPILLSWSLRRLAGNNAIDAPVATDAELQRVKAARAKEEEDSYWYQYDMGMLPESPHE